MNQGSIVLVPFPFSDISSQKQRPALVISKKNKWGDVIVVAISSKKHSPAVQINTKDLEEGELPIISYVRYDKIVTLHESLVRKVVATVNTSTLKDILKKVKALF